MGLTRDRAGILEHQIADPGSPEVWVRIGYDELGNPRVIYQSDAAAVWLSPDGQILFAFGAHIVSAPADVAAALNDALVQHVPAGKGILVADAVAKLQADFDAQQVAQDATLASFDDAILAKQAELASVELQLSDATAQLTAAPGVQAAP